MIATTNAQVPRAQIVALGPNLKTAIDDINERWANDLHVDYHDTDWSNIFQALKNQLNDLRNIKEKFALVDLRHGGCGGAEFSKEWGNYLKIYATKAFDDVSYKIYDLRKTLNLLELIAVYQSRHDFLESNCVENVIKAYKAFDESSLLAIPDNYKIEAISKQILKNVILGCQELDEGDDPDNQHYCGKIAQQRLELFDDNDLNIKEFLGENPGSV
jgi:hypothetical protein